MRERRLLMAPLSVNAYARAQAVSSSQAELVVMLYRGTIRFATKARMQMASRDVQGSHRSLLRAQEIVIELMIGFRPGTEQITQDLFALHNYIYQQLYQANIEKQIASIDEAIRHLRELLGAWESIALPSGPPKPAVARPSLDRHC